MAAGDLDAARTNQKRPHQHFRIAHTQDYEETRCLGAGGFSIVVVARHRITGETVAIKHVHSSKDPKQVEVELLREAHFLDACKSLPFMVGYHGLAHELATSELCLLMEYVGQTLQDYLCKHGRGPRLPEPMFRALMWQLLTGAQKMHDVHVVHRDIKPANILIGNGNWIVNICDLGLAISMSLLPPYTLAGTLPYIAPEMLLGKTNYDELINAWLLGCIMAELVVRRPLFQGADVTGQLSAIFNVLGVPDGRVWPEFMSMPLAAEVTKLQKQQRNRLCDIFPTETMSNEGFEVLKGLLTCNPDERLTAAAALKLPWFNKVEALALPLKDEAAILPSVSTKRKRVIIIPPAEPKRPRVLWA